MVLDPTELDARFVNEDDKYTDSDVETVIDAEIVDGQSIDAAIDSLISDHALDDNAHHEVVEAHADLSDTTLTGAYLEDLLSFGSANAAWMPVGTPAANSTITFVTSLESWAPQAAATTYYFAVIPLATTKGALKLHLGSVIIDGTAGFDAGSYIDEVKISGWSNATSSQTAVFTDGNNKTTNVVHTFTNAAPDDMSSYDYAFILVTTQNADTNLRMGTPIVEYYYAA